VTKVPYLATGLFALPIESRPGCQTIGIQRDWLLYADPALVDRKSAQEIGAVLVHLLSHVLREHAERARAIKDDDVAGSWLLAADAEVNDDLHVAGILSSAAPDLPSDIGAPDGRLAEEYLGPASYHVRRAVIDCGSGGDGKEREGERSFEHHQADDATRPGEGDKEAETQALSPYARKMVQRKVAEEIREAEGEEIGTVPFGWARWAETILSPQVDWRHELATVVRRAVASTAGAVDYSYRRPSRRAPRHSRVILPSLYRPVPEIAVVCDTSGSMHEELLGRALSEVEGILSSVGVRRSVRVIACDAAVHSVQRVSRAQQVTLLGGGGTDMGEGIRTAMALRPRPSVVVVLTDGFTPWPESAPKGLRVVIGLLRQGDRQIADPPQWARPVVISEG
jgi:predicted metal-dependent peptidase